MNRTTENRLCHLLLLWVALVAAPLWVATADAQSVAAAEPEDGALIIERLRAVRPDLPIEDVRAAKVPGMFRIQLSGGQMLYATGDAKYLFSGDLYEIGSEELVNLAERDRNASRRELLSLVENDDQLVFSPAEAPLTSITVFTDIDCGYCRKLHQEVPRLNELGIEVRYLAYPRAGLESDSYHKYVTAWCSEDKNATLTKMKAGETVAAVDCENPVAEQYQIGRTLGVTGTPAIVFPGGELVPGYVQADELARALGIEPT